MMFLPYYLETGCDDLYLNGRKMEGRFKTTFKKGQVANPNGRPKGAISEHRKHLQELMKKAACDVDRAYKELRTNMKAGESWAYQIYFKELIPKRLMQPMTQVEWKEGQSRVDAITEALNGFDELTHREVVEELNVLKNMEIKEEQKAKTSWIEKLSDEKLRIMQEWYNEIKNQDGE